ncbi:hypothetical protein [Enterococcus mundtii]|uniref:hypothetical protein n=1 Tax=Enterococcus mundtii TaxID=53346 RepID=UPI000CF1BC62|nr:hypothetical protein [Enterococcus mundtii]PQC31474.1 hypothetical protein CUM97_05850 [Enterococcus mundtii]
MRKIQKIALHKFSKSYLYVSLFFALILQGDHAIAATDEEILNPLNPSESVSPKNPERVPFPDEETMPSSKSEKAEEQVRRSQGDSSKKRESKTKVVKKEDFFHPVEHLVLNKRSKSIAGMGEDARVGKTNTGGMLATLSGKMLFGVGRLDGESYVTKETRYD